MKVTIVIEESEGGGQAGIKSTTCDDVSEKALGDITISSGMVSECKHGFCVYEFDGVNLLKCPQHYRSCTGGRTCRPEILVTGDIRSGLRAFHSNPNQPNRDFPECRFVVCCRANESSFPGSIGLREGAATLNSGVEIG